MNKLNDSLYYNKEQDRKLENEFFTIGNEFKQKLKEMELESVRLEVEIDRLKEEKVIKLIPTPPTIFYFFLKKNLF
jgi:hypothetical protein